MSVPNHIPAAQAPNPHGLISDKGIGEQSADFATSVYAPATYAKSGAAEPLPADTATDTRPLSERFWSKVAAPSPETCWEWLGGMSRKTGYGSFRVSRRGGNVGAHRQAFRLAKGDIPKGMLVCHTCDNRRCVNPAHLFLGTYEDNNRDCKAKGRNRWCPPEKQRRGTQLPSAKLTPDRVRELVSLAIPGDRSWRSLAKQFGISHTVATKILRGEKWKEVTAGLIPESFKLPRRRSSPLAPSPKGAR